MEGEKFPADWETESVQLAVNEIFALCGPEAEKVSQSINGIDDNLRVIEEFHKRLKDQHPNAVINIWVERLLTSILKRDYDVSEEIIHDRMMSHDTGGFQVGSKSFYELAKKHLQGTT